MFSEDNPYQDQFIMRDEESIYNFLSYKVESYMNDFGMYFEKLLEANPKISAIKKVVV